MIDRHFSSSPQRGSPASPLSLGAGTHLGAADPVIGVFIAGPLGALIGRVLAGTIEAVMRAKRGALTDKPLSLVAKPIAVTGKKQKHPSVGAKKKQPAAASPSPTKLSRKRRAKKP